MELKQVKILSAQVVTATGTSSSFSHQNGVSGIFTFSITATGGTTPSIVFKLQGQGIQSAIWYDLPDATLSAITANGSYIMVVDPALTPVVGTNAKVATLLPGNIRLAYTVTGTTPTFTVDSSAELY